MGSPNAVLFIGRKQESFSVTEYLLSQEESPFFSENKGRSQTNCVTDMCMNR